MRHYDPDIFRHVTQGNVEAGVRVFIAIFLIPSLWWLCQQLPVDATVQSGMFIFLLAAAFWLSELIHLSFTALMIPVVAVLLGLASPEQAFRNFAHPIIFLFLGGFALASAFRTQGLDRDIARLIIAATGSRPLLACLMLFLVAAILSMWISNTATTAMLMPIALGLLSSVKASEQQRLYWFVLLGIAYSASVGGMGTIIGSPPNAIAAATLNLAFMDWLRLAMPVVALALPVLWLGLFTLIRPNPSALRFDADANDAGIVWSQDKLIVLVVFALTASAWIFSRPLGELMGVSSQMDALIAIAATVVLGLSGLLPWVNLQRDTEWGVLLLFGGGLTLSFLLQDTGTSMWIAEQVSAGLQGMPDWALLFVLLLFVIFMTEFSSNTALAALLIPSFAISAEYLGLNVEQVTVAIAVAASCAFMLPVATPPNAIVFGTGFVPQRVMMRYGFVLNWGAALLLTLLFVTQLR